MNKRPTPGYASHGGSVSSVLCNPPEEMAESKPVVGFGGQFEPAPYEPRHRLED